jgi:ATP synthase protein I
VQPLFGTWDWFFKAFGAGRKGIMGEDDPKSSFEDLDARLQSARQRQMPPSRGSQQAKPLGVAMRISVELAAGLVVGGGIGYVLDRWLGTGPWLMIVFFFVGAAAGIRNVMRAARELNLSSQDDDIDDGPGPSD